MTTQSGKSNFLLILGSLLVLGGALLMVGRLTADSSPGTLTYKDTDVACLASGHQSVATHIHANLAIMVDGEPERVPANVGITPNCMAELHTHDATGEIHVETTRAARLSELSLADFFTVWEKSFEREGYAETLTVNGEEVENPEAVSFNDGDTIVVRYTRSEETPSSE